MQKEISYDWGERNLCGCGLSAFLSQTRKLYPGDLVVKSLNNMRERGNGLGAGYAGYGIYPAQKEYYALHLMYDDEDAQQLTEAYLRKQFRIFDAEPIPTRPLISINSSLLFHRYFVLPKEDALESEGMEQASDEFVMGRVMEINLNIQGAFVLSSGKNMGVFKGVGFPLEIGEFFRLEDYQGYCWIGHSRFPTNTPGWWGGAHPFTMLDTAVVHNGELSSYGINRRYVEMFGYCCTMRTDSEVVAYLFDLLYRRHQIPLEWLAKIFASEFWERIEQMEGEEKEIHKMLRQVYGSALLNGPFAIVVGHRHGMFGLSDRVKLRPMVCAVKKEVLYIASEESGIREICPDPERVWMPRAGELVAGFYQEDQQ